MMEPEDYIFIISGGYCLSAIIMWFVNLYLNIRLFRKSYEIIETNETFSLDSIQGVFQKQKEVFSRAVQLVCLQRPV